MGSESLAQLSNNLVYSAIAVYTIAMVAYAAEVAVEREADRLVRVALSLTILAFLLHAAGVVARGVVAGRPPWGNMYEFSITGALAVVGVYLLLLRRYDWHFLGVLLVPCVLLTLGLAVTVLYTEAAGLVPSLSSVWFVVHVSTVVLAAGVFTAGAALTVLHLLRARAEHRAAAVPAAAVVAAGTGAVAPAAPTARGAPGGLHPSASAGVGGWLGRLPDAERLDRLAYRLHAFAFPVFTFAVVAGAIWAESAWGRYWGWDPKETWAFITWLLYAAYLHARATAGWSGGKAGGIALAGCAALWFNYYGVNLWFSGLHSYAGVG